MLLKGQGHRYELAGFLWPMLLNGWSMGNIKSRLAPNKTYPKASMASFWWHTSQDRWLHFDGFFPPSLSQGGKGGSFWWHTSQALLRPGFLKPFCAFWVWYRGGFAFGALNIAVEKIWATHRYYTVSIRTGGDKKTTHLTWIQEGFFLTLCVDRNLY